jgi:hypothetical protein
MVDQTADAGSIGAGQQEPLDSNSWFYVTRFIVEQMMARLETAMPVQVTAIHPGSGTPPAAGTVDVQLLVSLLDGAGNVTQQGIVYGLPYYRPQGGKWSIILDPAVNDYGLIVSASRDASNVVKNPGIQSPGSTRKYSFSDGFYFGGFLNQVSDAYVWLKTDGTLKIADSKGNVLETSSSGFVFTGNVKVTGTLEATQLQTDDDGLTVTGNISATGTITAGQGGADQVGLQTHEHPTAAAGAPSPPTPGT